MPNSVPYEVLVGSGTAYIAPPGTALPDPGAALSAPWVKIGTAGDLNYDENTGVEFMVTETIAPWTPLGSNAPRKHFRTVEGVSVKLSVADMTLEQLTYALNGNTVTPVSAAPGVIGYKKIGLEKGQSIETYALLVRYNASPYMADGIMEYRHTLVQQKSEPKFTAKKGTPMTVDLEFMALPDPAAAAGEGLGVWLAQHEDAGT
ncbi:MAG: hypothetical protein AB7O32_00505 [Vicinamibacterales bacterium]